MFTHIGVDFLWENFQFFRRELGEKVVDVDIFEFVQVFAEEFAGRHGERRFQLGPGNSQHNHIIEQNLSKYKKKQV